MGMPPAGVKTIKQVQSFCEKKKNESTDGTELRDSDATGQLN